MKVSSACITRKQFSEVVKQDQYDLKRLTDPTPASNGMLLAFWEATHRIQKTTIIIAVQVGIVGKPDQCAKTPISRMARREIAAIQAQDERG